jgi:hypothetical protein
MSLVTPDISYQLIFCFLLDTELARFSRCCRNWRRIINDPYFIKLYKNNVLIRYATIITREGERKSQPIKLKIHDNFKCAVEFIVRTLKNGEELRKEIESNKGVAINIRTQSSPYFYYFRIARGIHGNFNLRHSSQFEINILKSGKHGVPLKIEFLSETFND